MNKREIKFRAWDGKLMRYLEHGEFILEYTGISEFSEYGDGARRHRDWPIMQFTSLKDKNGREIYEGDIVRYDFGAPRADHGLVDWSASELRWMLRRISSSTVAMRIELGKDFEVIGNIHENPELLKP